MSSGYQFAAPRCYTISVEPADKPIVLSRHAREQCAYRGCTEQEIAEVVRTTPWRPAELGRLECQKVLPFNSEWNGKRYATKGVRPIFAEEPAQLVVVTVYVYYKEAKG